MNLLYLRELYYIYFIFNTSGQCHAREHHLLYPNGMYLFTKKLSNSFFLKKFSIKEIFKDNFKVFAIMQKTFALRIIIFKLMFLKHCRKPEKIVTLQYFATTSSLVSSYSALSEFTSVGHIFCNRMPLEKHG